jgi:phosphatidylserine/phosphatidylglycerophosphate/cardiolipin synthase-like enzyme
MLSGSNDVGAIFDLVQAIPQTTVRFLPSLHAKVYIADEHRAIVTSGNFTDSGLRRNFEYGVQITAPNAVRKIRDDIVSYANLGSPIDSVQLGAFATVVAELRGIRDAADRNIRLRLRREFDARLRDVDDRILSVRTSGRTAHAIFADAILHVLRHGPRRTTEIHDAIQRIHPDLCDDSVDRVIDGQHFGKKWKHGVRTAQVSLRRRGEITLQDGLWHLVE